MTDYRQQWLHVPISLRCLRCGRWRTVPMDYRHIGEPIRIGCSRCEAITTHVPTGDDLRWAGLKLGFREHRDQEPIDGAQRDDQPTTSTTA